MRRLKAAVAESTHALLRERCIVVVRLELHNSRRDRLPGTAIPAVPFAETRTCYKAPIAQPCSQGCLTKQQPFGAQGVLEVMTHMGRTGAVLLSVESARMRHLRSVPGWLAISVIVEGHQRASLRGQPGESHRFGAMDWRLL